MPGLRPLSAQAYAVVECQAYAVVECQAYVLVRPTASAVLDKGGGDRGELAAVEGGDAEAATAAGSLGIEEDAAAARVVLGPPEDNDIDFSLDTVGVDGNPLGGRRSLRRSQ